MILRWILALLELSCPIANRNASALSDFAFRMNERARKTVPRQSRTSIQNVIWLVMATTVFLADLAYGQSSRSDIRFDVTREGESIQTVAHVDLPVAKDVVWAVLTDYERYPRFISSMRESRIVLRSPEGVVVEQKGSFSFLFFSQDIEARILVSAFPPNIIESQVLEGDFKIMNGRYDLRQVGNNVRLSFSGRLIPKFSLPPVIGMSIVRSILLRNFNEMVTEILRRNADIQVPVQANR